MDECKCWLESYKNSLTLRRQQSGEEKRQKGLNFSLVLLNSKKPAIKTLCIKNKEGKRDTKTRGLGCAKRKGIPEPLSAAQVSEQAEWRPWLGGASRLVSPCQHNLSPMPALARHWLFIAAQPPAPFSGKCKVDVEACVLWRWPQPWPGDAWLDLDKLPPHSASLWASLPQPCTCLSCSLTIAPSPP